MSDQETYLRNAFETVLTQELGATGLTMYLALTSGLQAPCYLVIEPESASQREYILFDGSIVTDTSIATSGIGNRYLAGSAAGSGLTHPVGSVVRMAPMAQHFEDLNDRIDADASDVATLEGEFDSHHGGTATTDHPEVTTGVRGFMSAADKTKLDGVETSATADQSAAEIKTAYEGLLAYSESLPSFPSDNAMVNDGGEGDAVLAGRVIKIGPLVHWKGSILIGSTTTLNAGYGFKVLLPYTVADTYKPIGTFLTNAGSFRFGIMYPTATAEGSLANAISADIDGGSVLTTTNPVTLDAGDSIFWSVFYETDE